MPEKNPDKLGWKPQPKSPIQWLDHWLKERVMWVPRTNYGITTVGIRDIRPVEPGEVHGDPDLLITTERKKQFYILFRKSNTLKSMDLPVLVWPPENGLPQAFWIMPVGWYGKRR